jgi:hypothetical protein
VELEDFLADGNSMTGIIAAAVPGHKINIGSQQIGNAAFTLVAPLSAYDNV